jgi:hypothetical protein
LLAKSQLWWKLLSVVIGCVPGDQLPCSLILPIISPAEAAAHAAIAETNKWVSQITTKVSDAQQEKLNEIQKEKDRLAEKQKQDLEDAEVAKAKREADQKEVDEKEKARVEKSHRQQMSKQEQEAAKAMISAKAVEERVKSLKEAVAVITQKQEDGEEITDDDVRVVMGYRNDLIVGHFIDPQENSTLADIINAASQSQSSTFPPATPIVKSSKHFSRQVVDLSYSDDETDGVDLVLKSHLRQIPWKSHGLTTAIITPTVFAITKITQEDQKLLANNSHAHDVIALGIQALKERNTAIAESSGGSDTTKRSYTMGPGASLSKPNSKKKKRFEIDSDAFTASVRSSSASAKSKGKRRQVPNFSSSEEEGEQGEHESEEGNN